MSEGAAIHPGRSQRVQFDSLQIGRGLAALLVVLVHADMVADHRYNASFARGLFASGWAGVDFFFVLSGFLIAFRHGKELGQPTFLKEFLWRRLIRIYPLYWVVTLSILPVYFLIPSFGQGDETSGQVIVASLLLFPIDRSPILVAGWSLIHELLFYSLFAFLIAVRSSLKWLVFLGWVVAVGLHARIPWNDHWNKTHPWTHLFVETRNLEFIMGCAAACFVMGARPRVGIPLTAGCLGITLFGLLSLGHARDQIIPSAVALRMFFGLASLLIIAGFTSWELHCHRQGKVAIPSSRIWSSLILLGEASYSLYILHGPVLSASCKLITSLGLTRRLGASFTCALGAASCVVAALVLHQFVEKPLLKWLRRPESIWKTLYRPSHAA